MLARHTPPDLTVRNTVKAVSKAGLMLSITGAKRHASWDTVNSVGVSVTANGDAEIFVIAMCIDDGETTSLFVITEVEKIWLDFTAILPIALPGTEPFERWGASLAQEPGVVMLYERTEQ